ncbi:MAG: chromosome segregation protein SMC [Methanomicrobiales archaeon]|nr:chromosome segregation protein SMC [Methanomicrobiales archaeon]
MHITQLEIDNFKSFGKKTKIPFFEGFTVISGPNGSGKSNIIDSVLFCLALSSARGLRAEKLTDLINLNSGKNTAEVTISFSDGTTVRRRIKRTGHGYYSYNYLNDRLCKQGDILEFLARFGIKPEGYNVVMQGDITRIMEMSDLERRRIIDEIAGVAEFDKKKEQSLAELEVVRERIEREELLLRELTLRLDELKNEREEALKYRTWQEKLAYFRNCHSVALLRERNRELASLHQLVAEQTLEIGTLQERKEAELAETGRLEGEIRAIDLQINEKSGKEYLALLSDLEGAKSAIKLAEQTISRLKQEKETNLDQIKKVYMDSKRAETRVAELSDAIRTLSIDRSNIAMELAGNRADLEKVERSLRLENDEVAGAKDELFAMMNRIEEQKAIRSDLLHQQDMLIERSRLRTSEIERLSNRLEQIEGEISEKEGQISEYAECIGRLESEKAVLDRDISTTESSLFSYRSSIEGLKKDIRTYEQGIMRLEAQAHAAGGAGGKVMEAILGMEGVYGTVAQLGRAPPEYTHALDTAAGGRLRYVVVENDTIAADAIRYLKENRLGRLTFLPLNKLRPPDLPPLKDRNVIDYAVNLLDYDPLFDPVFRLIFGATVIIDTLERARRMMGTYRMVTLEGELLEKSGAMTGGAQQQKKTLGFGIAADDELNRLRQELIGMEAELSDLELAVSRLTTQAEGLRRQRAGIDEQMARYRMLTEEYDRRNTDIVAERDAIRQSLTAMEEEIGGGSSRLAAIEEEIEGITRTITDLSSRIDHLKARLDKTGIPALSEQMERLRKDIAEHERRLRNKDADIADAQRERQYFSKRLEELEAERQRNEDRNRGIDSEIADSEASITAHRGKIATLEDRQKSFSKELDELRQQRDAITTAISAAEKRSLELQSGIERLSLQISSLRQREEALAAEIEALREAAADVQTDLTLPEIEEGIGNAERQLKAIGAVNMLAIDEFERVEKRVLERNEKKEVLSRERTLLIERIERFENMKLEAFMSAYTAIDENFRSIFARLTSGSGHLILDNEEDPFGGGMTFAVQPRDKKVHLLSSLSGGEKSLTTLAFIFSIQQYMPAPFYALDEIDMFLDASNVERIATLIKELSHDAQSIIVSLRRPTIERADRIVGVTLRPDKSTYVTGVKSNA